MKSLLISMIVIAAYTTTQAQSLNYILSTQIPVVEIKNGKKVTTVQVSDQLGSTRTNDTPRQVSFLGSPFFIDTFQIITFAIDSSTTPITAPVLLNLTNDELLVKLADKITPLKKVNFTLNGHDFTTINGRYYEQLSNGKVKLVKRYVRDLTPILVDNSNAGSGYGSVAKQYDGEISNKEIYYLVFHGDNMKEVKMNQKSVISVLTKENKSHFVNGDFGQMNENDALIKTLEKVFKIDEKELAKILEANEQVPLP